MKKLILIILISFMHMAAFACSDDSIIEKDSQTPPGQTKELQHTPDSYNPDNSIPSKSGEDNDEQRSTIDKNTTPPNQDTSKTPPTSSSTPPDEIAKFCYNQVPEIIYLHKEGFAKMVGNTQIAPADTSWVNIDSCGNNNTIDENKNNKQKPSNNGIGKQSIGSERIYAIKLKQKTTLKISVKSESPENSKLAVYIRKNCEEPIPQIACALFSGQGTPAEITHNFEPGVYYIFVDDLGPDDEPQQFSISIHIIDRIVT